MFDLRKNCSINFFNKKGFIGSIGDDLPSLIPIIVALLLFFTIFSITLNAYNEKNLLIRKNMSLMNISRFLKNDSLIFGVDSFESNCKRLKVNKFEDNFMTAIYSNDVLTKMFEEDYDFLDDFKNVDLDNPEDTENFLKMFNDNGENKVLFCNYQKIGGKKISDKKVNYVTRFYPVAIQNKVLVGDLEYVIISPGIMVMVIW